MMTAPPGRGLSFPLGNPPSSDKSSQNGRTAFGNARWGSEIWSSNVIGGGYSSKRDAVDSRGSNEASPTAPSGSAQLNHMSEAEPWAPRGGIWKSQDTSVQGRPPSGHTSPSHTRDNGMVQHSLQDSQYFPTRSAVGQNGNTVSKRSKEHGSMDASSTSFKNVPMFGVPTSEDKDKSAPYSNLASKYSYEHPSAPYKRGSQDHVFRTMAPPRENSTASSGVLTPAPLHGDISSYHFTPIPNDALSLSSRPSITHHALSFPSTGSARGSSSNQVAMDRGLPDMFKQSLKLDEALDSGVVGGMTGNSYAHTASQPFQLNPGSQPWPETNDVGNNGRAFGQAYQQEVYLEQMSGQFFGGAKRGSASPAGSVHRSSLNSPRYGPTPNPRADSWPRPPSANPALTQELERQHQLLQNPNYFASGGWASFPQYLPQPNPYDHYTQNSTFRNQVQPHSYMPINQFIPGVNIPVRPSRDTDPGKGMRSVLLEEFRASNKSNKRFELKDLYNHIVEFSGDQHGSRFIQEKLTTANSDEKDQVFREIEPNALQLMKDVFGNYVIQKFFEHGSQLQKKIIASQMKGKVAELSVQMYACRVVQRALEFVLAEQQAEIINELKPDIMRIVKDQNGNHVIQKIISMAPSLCVPFMMDAFRGHINVLAVHTYGCRVVQRLLEHGSEMERRELMDEVHACAPQLIADQYGNYVAQHIIAHGSPDDRSRMIRHVINELVPLSKHKFASNVVEKCIEHGTADEREAIRVKLTARSTDGSPLLQMMMRDQFGNYVIQKLVQQLEGPDRDTLIDEMRPQFASLKKISSGRQMTAIDRLMDVVDNKPTSSRKQSTSRSAVKVPTDPSLQLDVNSAMPTPGLTTEHNSPESNSPPSTNLSVGDETVEYKGKGKAPPVDGQVAVREDQAYEMSRDGVPREEE
ncbi:armadillo-type protein [Pseudomassariella vexata]|uniref:Pumilio homology domain family member 3 n=1 Tax=Pseudomassariella vexata TaxID=1141098 RepID=A0A1Y2EEU3_9PEZI|nr:armadillo-type protein [Pseudomassariella vexata]ORY70098.1 armadillo-type protein [Pseudomassariella vexata]